MTAYATVTELESRWRTLTDAEIVRATALLEDAATRIDIYAPLGEIPTEQDIAIRKIVSCNMVQRSMAAGEGPGLTQGSETAGPFSASWTFANPTGDMYLSRSDRALLGGGRARAGSVSMLGPTP